MPSATCTENGSIPREPQPSRGGGQGPAGFGTRAGCTEGARRPVPRQASARGHSAPACGTCAAARSAASSACQSPCSWAGCGTPHGSPRGPRSPGSTAPGAGAPHDTRKVFDEDRVEKLLAGWATAQAGNSGPAEAAAVGREAVSAAGGRPAVLRTLIAGSRHRPFDPVLAAGAVRQDLLGQPVADLGPVALHLVERCAQQLLLAVVQHLADRVAYARVVEFPPAR